MSFIFLLVLTFEYYSASLIICLLLYTIIQQEFISGNSSEINFSTDIIYIVKKELWIDIKKKKSCTIDHI